MIEITAQFWNIPWNQICLHERYKKPYCYLVCYQLQHFPTTPFSNLHIMSEIVYSSESKPDLATMNPSLKSSNTAHQSIVQPWVCTMSNDTIKGAQGTITEAGILFFQHLLEQAISMEMERKQDADQKTYLIAEDGMDVASFEYHWMQKYTLDTHNYGGSAYLMHSHIAISGTFYPLIDTCPVEGVELISQRYEDFPVGNLLGILGFPFVFNFNKHETMNWPEPEPNPQPKPPARPRPKPPPRPPPQPPRPGP